MYGPVSYTHLKLKEYNDYYVGDAGEKKIYLTFDCGYENGNTSQILDALKKHDAPATFKELSLMQYSQTKMK